MYNILLEVLLMYFCPNCGKQYENEVAFCAVCGAKTVAPAATPAPSYVMAEPIVDAVAETNTEKEPIVTTILGFAAKISQIFAGMFALVSIIGAYLDINISKYYSYAYGSFEPAVGSAIFTLLCALCALGTSGVCFVFSLIKKTDLKTKFSKIASLTLSLALFIVSCVLLANC